MANLEKVTIVDGKDTYQLLLPVEDSTGKIDNLDVRVSYDFSEFKHFTGNRATNTPAFERKAKKLRASLLEFNKQIVPIQVDSQFRIKDGQKRVIVLYRMFLAGEWTQGIKYQITEDSNIREIQEMNNFKSDWTADDYASSWAELGKEDYQVYLDFRSSYNLPMQETISLLLDVSSGGSSYDKFKKGEFVSQNPDSAHITAKRIVSLSEMLPNIGLNRFFIRAMIYLLGRSDFSYSEFVAKLKVQRGAFQPQLNTERYIQACQDVYNYHRPKTEKKVFVQPK